MNPVTMRMSLEQCSKALREDYAQLTDKRKQQATVIAVALYDGTRTISQCWREAIDLKLGSQ